MSRYSHTFDVAFSVECGLEFYGDVPLNLIIEGLEKRIAYLRANPEDALEAFGLLDTIGSED